MREPGKELCQILMNGVRKRISCHVVALPLSAKLFLQGAKPSPKAELVFDAGDCARATLATGLWLLPKSIAEPWRHRG